MASWLRYIRPFFLHSYSLAPTTILSNLPPFLFMIEFSSQNGWREVAETIFDHIVKDLGRDTPESFACSRCAEGRLLRERLLSASRQPSRTWRRDNSNSTRRWRCTLSKCTWGNEDFVKHAVKNLSPLLLTPPLRFGLNLLRPRLQSTTEPISLDLLRLVGSVVKLEGEFLEALSTGVYQHPPSFPPLPLRTVSPAAKGRVVGKPATIDTTSSDEDLPAIIDTTSSNEDLPVIIDTTSSDEDLAFTYRPQKRRRSPTSPSSAEGSPDTKKLKTTTTNLFFPPLFSPPSPVNATPQDPQPPPANPRPEEKQGQECCCSCHPARASPPTPARTTEPPPPPPPPSTKGRRRKRGNKAARFGAA